MVVIELEPEEATRPSSPASEEKAAAAAGGEAARPSSSAAPEEAPTAAAAAAVGGEASRAAGEEEEAFEDALTDEQLREVVPWPPRILIAFPLTFADELFGWLVSRILGFINIVTRMCQLQL